MNNLNSVLVEGNLVRDPEYRVTPKGTPVCTFSIATNRYFNQGSGMEKEVSYFQVETWSKLAESVNKQGRKGRTILVVGRLKQERWQDGEGKQNSRIIVVAEHVEFKPEYKPKQEREDKRTNDGYER
jgi:single-strand DNA-binding protein